MSEPTTLEGERLNDWLPAMCARAPDPGAAGAGLRRYWQAASPAQRGLLESDPALLEALLTLFSNSEFLAETLVGSPELLLWLQHARRDNSGRARDEWSKSLSEFTSALPPSDRALGLARFKRREYLRIVCRDLQGLASLAETTAELSHLADAILEQAYAWAWNDLAGRFGTPQSLRGTGAELAVIGLGKLGALELNYSSDIDLMFLYSTGGETGGGERATTNREFFTRLAQSITSYVSTMTAEGPAYRVDLRLRPGGREGEVALGLEAAIAYYRRRAWAWELQMLIRARPCAGSRLLAQRFLDAVNPGVYPPAPDPVDVADGVRRSRQRINAQLEHHRAIGRRRPEVDVKLDAGGIRDIEFLVQYLQRLHGGREVWIQTGNTVQAMQRLHDKHRLAAAEFHLLSSAYWLLRQIEHRLQLRLGQQTHTLPSQPERLWSLARSLRLAEGGRLAADAGSWLSDAATGAGSRATLASQLLLELDRRMAAVHELYESYLGEGRALPLRMPGPAPGGSAAAAAAPEARWARELDLTRHGRRQWQRLFRSTATLPQGEAALDALSPLARSRLRIALEQSDWMLETLVRRPMLLPALEPASGGSELSLGDGESFASGLSALRDYRQRRTLQLLAEEWECPRPLPEIFDTYSSVAETILSAALDLARRFAPPAPTLAVLGLGRLGLRELDLLSDMDLVFVSSEPDREAAARLVAKLIEALAAYTQSGSLYAVDTRLRPGGGEGELVQTPASLAVYFEQTAGVWEAFSYLKARTVCGDFAVGVEALTTVQLLCIQRFSGGSISRSELAALRERMQRAGRPGRWGLKTPPGGYYDVDFLASRLWLQARRTSQAALGLPAVVRQLAPAYLPPAQAEDLASACEDLRLADHALRAGTGKAGSAIPASGEAVDRAGAWLSRQRPRTDPGDLPRIVDHACERIHRIYLQWR